MRHMKRDIYERGKGKFRGLLFKVREKATIAINPDELYVGTTIVKGKEVVVENDLTERRWIINPELSKILQRSEKVAKIVRRARKKK